MTQNITEKESIFSDIINPNTNKPVKVGKSVSFNQKTYDDINYMQAKNDLFDDFNKTFDIPSQTGNINTDTLNNIPVVPAFLQKEYEEANNFNTAWLDLLEVATPDEIEEWRQKGRIGLVEAMQRAMSLRGLAKGSMHIPFVGTTAEVAYDIGLLNSINRLKKGEQISEKEKDVLVDYLRELKEIQVRGTTVPNKAINAALNSIPYMIEFGVGVGAEGATFGGSTAVSAGALSKAAAKKAARKAVEKALKEASTESLMTGTKKALSLTAAKGIYKNTQKSIIESGAKGAIGELGIKESAKIIAKNTPKDIAKATIGSNAMRYMTGKNLVGGYTERQLDTSFSITDAGELAFSNPENPALSFFKALGSTVFENYTETTGWMFAPVTSYFAKPIQKVMPKKFFTGFEKLVESRYGMKATNALKKYGYDGVIEEMGEEVLNRFLCQTFGINGLESYNLEGFMNNVFYADKPEEWLSEALSFAIMGGAGHAAQGSYSALKEYFEKRGNDKAVAELTKISNMPEAERLKYLKQLRDDFRKKNPVSVEEFMLEQGLIHIEGAQSAAEQMLRKKLEENGVDKETIDEFCKASSELEIRNKLKEITKNENKKITIEDRQRRNKLKNKFFTQILNANQDKEFALQNAKITIFILTLRSL